MLKVVGGLTLGGRVTYSGLRGLTLSGGVSLFGLGGFTLGGGVTYAGVGGLLLALPTYLLVDVTYSGHGWLTSCVLVLPDLRTYTLWRSLHSFGLGGLWKLTLVAVLGHFGFGELSLGGGVKCFGFAKLAYTLCDQFWFDELKLLAMEHAFLGVGGLTLGGGVALFGLGGFTLGGGVTYAGVGGLTLGGIIYSGLGGLTLGGGVALFGLGGLTLGGGVE
ncbi:hypothetical protein Tco_1122419 [Tanacetum coccineum]|uniref:Uncharacterized protein n=1 Tax=Tanacetum coccineum TaxID=301880 RepID=A0ABQ5J0Q1_9ASTR